ncbi:MAG: XRE family transcriptional regulator [Solirubrobacterales bacterium]
MESSISQSVGANVKRLRRERGMSLAELGRSARLAKGTLAAIEQGRGNPTVETLHSLTRALGATLGELVSEAPPSGTRVVRKGEGPLLPGDNMDVRLLSRTPGGGFVLELYALSLGRDLCQNSSAHTPGVQEEIVVTQGRLRVGPEDDLVELGKGDFAAYTADAPHRYESLDGKPAAAVLLMRFPAPSVVTPSGYEQ